MLLGLAGAWGTSATGQPAEPEPLTLEPVVVTATVAPLPLDLQNVSAQQVVITADTLSVDLADGRTIAVPLTWYPRLLHGTPEERNHWRLIGQGEGIHWPALDEDISVENLLAGKASSESQRSFQQWLKARTAQCPS